MTLGTPSSQEDIQELRSHATEMERKCEFAQHFQQVSMEWLSTLARGGSIGSFLDSMVSSLHPLLPGCYMLCLVSDDGGDWYKACGDDTLSVLLNEKGAIQRPPSAFITFAASPSRSKNIASHVQSDAGWAEWKEFLKDKFIEHIAMASVYYGRSSYLFIVFMEQKAPIPLDYLNFSIEDCVKWIQASLVRENADQLLLEDGHRDPETGLLRKYSFEHSFGMVLKDSRRHFQRVAILSLSLPSSISDVSGPELKALADEMIATVRDNDLIARCDEREFAMGIRIRHMEDAEVVASKLLKAILSPDFEGKRLVSQGVSIGIAFYPEHSSLDSLYKSALDASHAITTGSGYRLEYHGAIYESSNDFYSF